jgi:hypothetical protein
MARTKDVMTDPVCSIHQLSQNTHGGDEKRSYGIHSTRKDSHAAPLDDFFLLGVNCGSILRKEL